MCYLNNLASNQGLDFDDIFKKGEETYTQQTETQPNILIPCPHKFIQPIWSEEQRMLVSLFQLIQKNSTLIRNMQKNLCGTSEIIENNSIQTVKTQKNSLFQNSQNQKNEELSSYSPIENLKLSDRLFGTRKYKYFLQLAEQFPNVLYKQRNFNLAIKLVDSCGKIIRNCNILNLCCAVATSDAIWIHENRIGEPFMKGKTQVELYKGEASFVKLYARDVSRVYSGGKVNLVIYSKPSTLLYSGSHQFQAIINSEDVQPLIIQDLVIKAKKKQ